MSTQVYFCKDKFEMSRIAALLSDKKVVIQGKDTSRLAIIQSDTDDLLFAKDDPTPHCWVLVSDDATVQ